MTKQTILNKISNYTNDQLISKYNKLDARLFNYCHVDEIYKGELSFTKDLVVILRDEILNRKIEDVLLFGMWGDEKILYDIRVVIKENKDLSFIDTRTVKVKFRQEFRSYGNLLDDIDITGHECLESGEYRCIIVMNTKYFSSYDCETDFYIYKAERVR